MPASTFSLVLSLETLLLFLHHHGPILLVFASQFYVFEAPDDIVASSTKISELEFAVQYLKTILDSTQACGKFANSDIPLKVQKQMA